MEHVVVSPGTELQEEKVAIIEESKKTAEMTMNFEEPSGGYHYSLEFLEAPDTRGVCLLSFVHRPPPRSPKKDWGKDKRLENAVVPVGKTCLSL